jgi:hypothetical protein
MASAWLRRQLRRPLGASIVPCERHITVIGMARYDLTIQSALFLSACAIASVIGSEHNNMLYIYIYIYIV